MALVAGVCTPSSTLAQCPGYAFFASDSMGCENDIFSFYTVPKAPKAALLNWDFETKQVSNNPNPSVAFTTADTISVTLYLALPGGNSCTLKKADYITIGQNPKINSLTVSHKELCDIGKEAMLTISSPAAKRITWALEGSSYGGSAKSIKHTFTKPGYATLQLVVEGQFGCSTKKIYDSILFVDRKPLVTFPFTDTTLCGATRFRCNPKVVFYGHKQFDFNWGMQGATPNSSTVSPPFKVDYPNTNSAHDISLTLSSKASSCTFNYLYPDVIKVVSAPSLQVDAQPLNGPGCKNAKFSMVLKNPGIDADKVVWSHTHGDSLELSKKGGDSIIATGKYTGKYTVKVSYPFANCTKSATVSIATENNPVAARMDRNLSCICKVPSQITVLNRSSHAGAVPMTYLWTLTNAKGKFIASSTDTHFRWRADRYGNFTLNIKATDTDGCYDIGSFAFKARPLLPWFVVSPSVACPGTEVAYELDDTLCVGTIDTLTWTFFQTDKSIKDTKKGKEVQEKYQDTGWYATRVTVKTQEGCLASTTIDSCLHITELNQLQADIPKGPFCVGDEVKLSYQAFPAEMVGEWYGVFTHDDTTVYSKLGDSIKFNPPLPGWYDVKVVFVTDECSDSLVFNQALEIGGVTFDFTPLQLSGCIPFTTTLKPMVGLNVLVGTTDKSLAYTWTIDPLSRGNIADANARDAEVTVSKAGNIDIGLTISNAQGCSATVEKKGLFNIGLSAGFSLPNDSLCRGLEYHISNTSTGFASVKWESNDPATVFLPSDTSSQPVVIFGSTGINHIQIRAIDMGGCKDSLSYAYQIMDFDLGFDVDDTSAQCSPAQYLFTARATNVDTFIWNFDDDRGPVSTTLLDYLKIFDLTRIYPYRNAFHVALLGKNKMGCQDSVFLPQPLKVLGPVPKFFIKQNMGCAPFTAQFIDSSINAHKVYVDFGDNTSIDSINYLSHTYVLPDSLEEYAAYRPFIIVKDKNDCKLSYRTPDTLFVYAPPRARFRAQPHTACAPARLRFSDTSRFAYSWKWLWDDGKELLGNYPLAEHTYGTGTYQPTLVAFNKVGCADSFSLSRSIELLQPPAALFNPFDTIACVGQGIDFRDSTTSIYPLRSWMWEFGLGGNADTSYRQHPTFVYGAPGTYHVTLVATDSNGCSDTLIQSELMDVYDKLPIAPPLIHQVGVVDDRAVEVSFLATERFAFSSYALFELGTNTKVYETTRRTDTTVLVHQPNWLFPDSNTYCFRLQVTDKCEFTHGSDTHCTIWLGIDTSDKQVGQLHWTPYNGWKDDLQHYQVLRTINDGSATDLIAIVPPSTRFYSDSTVCNKDYRYEVRAAHTNNRWVSLSNDRIYTPEYVFQSKPLGMHLATVEGEGVRVIWQRGIQRNVLYYTLDRRQPGYAWARDWRVVTDTTYLDTNAQVLQQYYQYRVRAVDECGYVSKPSKLANSILLQARPTTRDFGLAWNAYRDWPQGVEKYAVLRRGPNDSLFYLLAVLAGTDTAFLDTSAFLLFDQPFAYQVVAHEKGGQRQASYANQVMVAPLPSMFVPTAFTPNGDGTNDLFVIKGFGLIDPEANNDGFQVLLYNRWGERVYQSNDWNDGWDGLFKGSPCPAGHYLCVVSAQGINGQLLFSTSTVLLIR